MTSPRPWKRNGNVIKAADGSLVLLLDNTIGDAPWVVRARKDADLIVQAVNERDDLVAALEALEILVERCDGAEGVRADDSNIDTQHAHDAIRKARGEQVSA